MPPEIPLAAELGDLPQSKELDKAVLLLEEAKFFVQKGEYVRGIETFISAVRCVDTNRPCWVFVGQHLLSLWIELIQHAKKNDSTIYTVLEGHQPSVLDTISIFEAPRMIPGKGNPGRLKPKFISTGDSTRVTHELEGVLNPKEEVYSRLEVLKELVAHH